MAESGFRQDMPPSGGYRKFNYGRTFPKLVWRPGVVVAAVFGASVYGAFDSIAKKKARVTEKFEDVDITNAMQPFLTAERTWYGEPVYFTLGDKWWDPMQSEVFAHSHKDLFFKEHFWRHHSEYAAPKFYDKWIPESIGKYFW
ncbi:GRIM-19 protein [Necator americanus]|uniref:NADH dehydrogenase [ubiquinone] 1 alpha subcomplex subunit 13 n=1 Tax=Necator americanus TaxID=51031 RepID=W2TVM8_NECAM|nr:GRIM-19 protein [Necator americanus]ETN85853.1 GRIM-19 protein [Necator americanus]